MTASMFYKILKIFSGLGTILIAVCFVFSLLRLSAVDKFIMAGIFIADICVCGYLIKYYGNAIMKTVFFNDNVTFIKANKKSVTLKREDCIKIVETGTRFICCFSDNRNYYTIKYYGFKKHKFDFSLFNTDNFPNAKQSGNSL